MYTEDTRLFSLKKAALIGIIASTLVGLAGYGFYKYMPWTEKTPSNRVKILPLKKTTPPIIRSPSACILPPLHRAPHKLEKTSEEYSEDSSRETEETSGKMIAKEHSEEKVCRLGLNRDTGLFLELIAEIEVPHSMCAEKTKKLPSASV